VGARFALAAGAVEVAPVVEEDESLFWVHPESSRTNTKPMASQPRMACPGKGEGKRLAEGG
jgi:hypothetical protein